MAEVRRIEQASKEEKSKLEARIKTMEGKLESVGDHKNQMDANLDKTKKEEREEMGKAVAHQQDMIERQGDKLESTVNSLTEEIDTVKLRTHGITSELTQHSNQLEGLDNKLRSSNLVVKGLAEKNDDETKAELVQIISKEINSFSDQHIKSITRMGKKNDKRKKPRLLLVTLQDATHRDLIISRASETKKKANVNSFWINKDQNDSSKRRYALVKAC